MTVQEEAWQCVDCDQWWPAYTTVEAYNKRVRAAKIHPSQECRKPERLITQTDIMLAILAPSEYMDGGVLPPVLQWRRMRNDVIGRLNNSAEEIIASVIQDYKEGHYQ